MHFLFTSWLFLVGTEKESKGVGEEESGYVQLKIAAELKSVIIQLYGSDGHSEVSWETAATIVLSLTPEGTTVFRERSIISSVSAVGHSPGSEWSAALHQCSRGRGEASWVRCN